MEPSTNNESEKEARLRELLTIFAASSGAVGRLNVFRYDDHAKALRAENKVAYEAIISFVKENYVVREECMSDEILIGPNPCPECGGEYGQHISTTIFGVTTPCSNDDNPKEKLGFISQDDHLKLLAKIEAMGRLLDGIEHARNPWEGNKQCWHDCPACAWEKLRGGKRKATHG